MAVKELAQDEAVRSRTAAPRPRAGQETGPALAHPMPERRGGLPPSNELPSEARAANFVGISASAPDAVARAKMSLGLQQQIGNAGMAALVVAPPRPAVPVKTEAKVAAPAPAPAAAPGAPVKSPLTPAAPAPNVAPTPTTATAAPAPTVAAPAATPPAAAAGAPVATAVPSQAKPGKKSDEAAGKGEPGSAEGPAAPVTGKAGAAAAKRHHPGAAGAHPGAAGEEPPAAGPVAGKKGGGGREVVLKMKEPPADISPASHKRLAASRSAAGHAAGAAAALPSAASHVDEARGAVTPPSAEADAKAAADLVTALGQRPKPSPEVEQLCQQIYAIITSKTPDDEPSLIATDPEKMASDAGDQLKGNVQGDVNKVGESYSPLDQKPAGTPGQPGQPVTDPGAAAPTPPIDAANAAPDPIPPEDASLDADAADAKSQTAAAGMDTEAAKLAKSGPVADARAAQGELDTTAKEDPAKVIAQQQTTLAKASSDMAALQKSAMDALVASRKATTSHAGAQQHQMVGSEESMRTQASTQAQAIFSEAQTKVNALLQPLPQTATQKWDAGVAIASRKFKQALKQVEDWLKDRHSGVGGAVLGVWDDVTGLPGWVTDEYKKAEEIFGNEICDLARGISTDVNGVIMACEAIIGDARSRINGVFASLPASLQTWAAGEQGKFGQQLDGLTQHAHDVQNNFTRDLVKSASQSFQDARDQLHALREKAKGLIGRIKDAIDAFLKDPVKFIIEALLEILSIPPAAFWAVVAKIQKVVKDIADDPLKFASNLMKAIGQGFSQFFDHILTHLLKGFINWLTGGLASAGVMLPKDASLKSIVTFILQLMGITWPRIRKLLAKHIGEQNVALLEKAYAIVANLIALGPEGVFEMIKQKLDPATILNQIIKAAVDYMIKAVVEAVAARIILLFNPVGAVLEALEAIYRVLKWIFVNAARIFHLVETVVNGIADIIAGNIGGLANAVEKALAQLIPPVIDFLADYLGFGDLPDKVRDTILSLQAWVEGVLDEVIGWLVEKGKALLKAIGLGGDEKDKKKGKGEVGESVAFTAGAEQHRLWVEVSVGKPKIMMASGAAAVVDYLGSDRVKKAAGADPSLNAKVSEASQLAGATDLDAKKVLDEMAASKEDDASKDNQTVKSKEQQLAGLLAEILNAVKEGLSIFDIIGKPIDPLPETPEPDGYQFYKYRDLREIKRAPGKGAKGGENQYPPVHVDQPGTVQSGTGLLRFDYKLKDDYGEAIAQAQLDADEAPGNAQGLANQIVPGKPPEFLEGIRAQMLQIISDIKGGQDVTGVEVKIGRKRIDYTLEVQTATGIENVLVEYKHWTGKISKTRRPELVAKLTAQLTGFVDSARSQGNDYRRLIIKWPAWSTLDPVSKGQFTLVFQALNVRNAALPPERRITIEIDKA